MDASKSCFMRKVLSLDLRLGSGFDFFDSGRRQGFTWAASWAYVGQLFHPVHNVHIASFGVSVPVSFGHLPKKRH